MLFGYLAQVAQGLAKAHHVPLDSQDARTPMNGKPMTDLIQPIARTESLSRDAGL